MSSSLPTAIPSVRLTVNARCLPHPSHVPRTPAFGLFVERVVGRGLQGSVLLSSVIVARLLGMTSFGAYAILVSTVMTIATIAQGGSGLVASKFVAESLASDPERVARVLRMCRVFTLATGACTGGLVFAAADAQRGHAWPARTRIAVRLVAVATFFQVTVSYQFGALQGFGAFKALSRGGALAGLATSPSPRRCLARPSSTAH